ncbi:MAG: hypothetical protein VX482_05380, partial [Candidatus Thermoplasmatota archaeon]|nr:hypothetical protein [Candidatus Thermoplasmatota archaeon]
EDGEEGRFGYKHDDCTWDGSMPAGHEDDPEGWYHMGAIHGLEQGVSYNITTSDEFSAVSEDLIINLVTGLLAGILGIGGGISCICCGVGIMVVGGLLAVTSGGNKPQTQIQINPSVEVDSNNEENEDEYDKGQESWYEE